MTGEKRIGALRPVCVVVFVVALSHGGALAGTDPTPAQIVADWNAMSGGVPAKVVYWCNDNSGICVMDLSTGAVTTMLTQLDMGGGNWRAVAQSNSWGPFPCWSPDGTRIYFFNQDNDWCHWVMNADGSNPKRIGAIDDGGHWLGSWYDNDSVVYNDISTANNEIVKVTIDASNNPVGRTVLIPDPPYGGSGRSYVTASGTYVAWTDGNANVPTGGVHRSVVRNFNGPAPPNQDEMEVIARDDDACDICIKPDGSGTAVYCHANHGNATAKTYQDGENPSTDLFVWGPVQGEQLHWLRWSQHPDYICYNDDRARSLANQRAYIRKVPDGTNWMFLGYGIWGPDVWVDANALPVATPQSVSTDEDVPLSVTLTATDDDGDPLTYRVVAQPAHGTISGSPPGVTYTPAQDYNGPDSFTFVANDGHADSAEATVSVTVDPVDDPPVAHDASATVDEDATLSVTLQVTEVDGDALTYAVTAPPAHGQLTGTAPDLTYAPDADYHGPDQFTFTADDGTSTTLPATVDITVLPVNDAPVVASAGALPAGVTLPSGTTLAVSAIDVDLDGLTYAWTVSSGPAGATVASPTASTTSVTFSSAGDYVFAIAVSDGTETTSRSVRVVVLDAADDTDADGMADDWETTQFGDLSRDGTGDADSDGLDDLDEFVLGADPHVVDTDGDGMDDGDEAAHFFDPTDGDQDGNGTPDGQDDWDGDGVQNAVDATPGFPSPAPPVPEDDKSPLSCGSPGTDVEIAAWLLACIALAARKRRVGAE